MNLAFLFNHLSLKASESKGIYYYVVKDGIPFILLFLLPALLCLALGWFFGLWWLYLVAVGCFAVAAFMAYFFRDPERTITTDTDVVVAPADGLITRIAPLNPNAPQAAQVVSIFLSPLDVHINRAPIAGRVTAVNYTKGRYLMATKEEASLVNEQNAITIEGPQITVVCKQIAGILARRIVCWKKSGDSVALGERFGLIKFSSRTDLILPPSVKLLVAVGQRVQGGVTIIGKVQP